MAEVKAPLMSMAASGKFNDEVVFFQRNGRQLVRSYVKHDGGDSEAVRKNRNIFREAAGLSRLLTDLDRQAWNTMTEGQAINGHNLFMKQAMQALYDGQDFLPVYGVEFFIYPSPGRIEAGRLLEVNFYGESSARYNVLLGGGTYPDWAGRDADGQGNYGQLLMLEEAKTLDTGVGGFIIDGLDRTGNYWFKLEEIDGSGFSAAYQLELNPGIVEPGLGVGLL